MPIDHWVPQFYLRNFAIPSQNGWIICYQRNRVPQPQAIRSVACEENYYTLRSNLPDVQEDQVDKLFKPLETDTAIIIKHLLTASNTRLHPDDKEVLAMFIALQAFRTPQARERLMRMDAAARIQLMRLFVNKAEAFSETANQAGVVPQTAERARQYALNSGDLQVEYESGHTEDYFMGLAIKTADEITPILKAKHWHLVESADAGAFFVTSDHPVVLSGRKGSELCLGFGQGPILFPISPTRCLLLSDELISNNVVQLGRNEASAINELIVEDALDSVFADRVSSEIQEILNRTEQPGRVRVRTSE